LAEALRARFAEDFSLLVSAEKQHSFSKNLAMAKTSDCDFLIYPELVSLSNNHNTLKEIQRRAKIEGAYNIGRDEVFLVLGVYDVRSGLMVDHVEVRASEAFSFSGDGHLDELINKSAIASNVFSRL